MKTVLRSVLSTLPLGLVLLAGDATAAPSAQTSERSTLEALHVATMSSVSYARISPDGRHVAYVKSVQRTPRDEEDGPSRSQLHVLDVESGQSRAFVTADSGVSTVRWAPDGSRIAFLAKRDGDDQRSLYTIAIDGGEAQRVLQLDDRGISSYAFAPTGDRVALLTTPPAPKEQDQNAKKGFKPEIYEEQLRHGEIWIAALGDGPEPRNLDVDGHVSGFVWSPSGHALAAYVAPTALVDDSYMEKRVWIVDANDGSVLERVANRGKLDSVAWSPDGRKLALIAAFDEHDGAAARLLMADVGKRDGSETSPRPVLPARERDEGQAVFLPDGSLCVLGSQGCWSTLDLYGVTSSGVDERRPLLPLEGPVWTSMTASKDGGRIALVGSTPTHANEVYTLDVSSGTLQRRTDSNPWLADVQLGQQEVIRYPARDGLEVEGVLMRPVGVTGPVPLIVVVHGGPEAHRSNGWLTRYSNPGQVAAGQGYAIFVPNYRGSTGRGLAYLKSSQGDPAGAEFDDVVDGVDYLIAQGIADRDKVGVTGGSYGGYATAWMSTYYSDRFAAGVMSVGISNKISKVGTTDIANEEFFVHAMKRPWDDWQFFLERSPIYYAGQSQTPLLILHGKDDTRVDPGQSQEMYRHLKLRGKAPVRLVNYPGEGHGNRKAGARFDYSLRMLRWFDHYLKGDGGAAPDYPVDYDAHLPSEAADEPGAPGS